MDIEVLSPPASDLRYYNSFIPNLEHEEKQRRVLEVAMNVLVLSKTRLEVWTIFKQTIIYFICRKTYWYDLETNANYAYKTDTNKLYDHIQYKN
jgi:hypothetical protein